MGRGADQSGLAGGAFPFPQGKRAAPAKAVVARVAGSGTVPRLEAHVACRREALASSSGGWSEARSGAPRRTGESDKTLEEASKLLLDLLFREGSVLAEHRLGAGHQQTLLGPQDGA